MKHYIFSIKEGSDEEGASEELTLAGVSGIYFIEDYHSGEQILGGWTDEDLKNAAFEHIDAFQSTPAGEVDWQDQWACFDPSFEDGLCRLELQTLGAEKDLFLLPGAGFGNLSHPTTRLMLSFLQKLAPHHDVVDIGCGSGILSLAAALFHAKHCWGIDIDDAAIAHAQANAVYNQLEGKTTFSKILSIPPPPPLLVCMNMIFTEQREAWQQNSRLQPLKKKILTSGILPEERDAYLEWTWSLNWDLLEEKEGEGWLAFLFSS